MTSGRVAVAGGTGLVGRMLVDALSAAGSDVVVLSRANGVDLTTGEGLDASLGGVVAVVDVTSTLAQARHEVEAFFQAETSNLLAAEQRAGVSHHVLLSIVNVDRVEGNAHYAGKRRQEQLVRAGAVPWTIVRAAQFFEFAEMVVGWTRTGDSAVVPPLLLQPTAATDVADVLAEVAVEPARNEAFDVVGPETLDFVDMARRVLDARGTPLRLVASWRDGPFGAEMAGEACLADAGARVTPTTFDDWLSRIDTTVPDDTRTSSRRATPDLVMVLDANDPAAIASFWAGALGYDIREPVGQYHVLTPSPGDDGPVLLVQRVGELKTVKNRMHLDLHVDDPEAEAARLIGLGATRHGVGALGEIRWITMADPEGNEFDLAWN